MVGRNPLAALNGKPCTDQRTAPAGLRAADKESRVADIREASVQAVGGVAVFMLPRNADLRPHDHIPHFPVVACLEAQGTAHRFGIAAVDVQRREGTAPGEVVDSHHIEFTAVGRAARHPLECAALGVVAVVAAVDGDIGIPAADEGRGTGAQPAARQLLRRRSTASRRNSSS